MGRFTFFFIIAVFVGDAIAGDRPLDAIDYAGFLISALIVTALTGRRDEVPAGSPPATPPAARATPMASAPPNREARGPQVPVAQAPATSETPWWVVSLRQGVIGIPITLVSVALQKALFD